MGSTESDGERWVQRLRDAAIEATCAGADERTLDDALREGVAEGLRLLALRRPQPDAVPAPRRPSPYPRDEQATRPAVIAEPGSALAALLNATR